MYKFKFADIGEGLHEGTVGEIYLKVGDKVNEGDPLFSVETDKVTSDIPSPVTGTIKEVLIKTGETVHVGDDTMHIDDGSGESAPAEEPKKVEVKSETAGEESASVVGDIKVSNDVFSFDSFKKSPKKAAQAKTTTAKSVKTISTNTGIELPNPADVKPIGKGEAVDFVVIGGGPGGYDVTTKLAKLGHKIVVIEDRFAGGVCLNIGCIPTKTLLKGAKVLSYMKHGEDLGIVNGMKDVKVNWEKMLKRKTDISKQLEMGVEFLIKSAKAEFIKGRAEIVDKYNVKVNNRVFTTKYIIIASGSRPVILNKLPGFDKGYKDETIVTSTGALNFKEIPKKLSIVGGGVIGVEFATLFNELGTEVTILEGADNILGPMDLEVKKQVKEILVDKGISIKTGVKVTGYEKGNVIYEENGKSQKLPTEKVLVSVGRIPNNLGADKTVGLELGKRGEIVVNNIMQTTVPNIFAIGDVVGHAMLAHTAYRHASVVTDAFKGVNNPYNKHRIPGVVYIYPEISSIGYTEEELKKEKIDYFPSTWKNVNVGRALAEDDKVGFTKLLIEPKYGTILGAHLINASSSEMIAEIAAVMELEGTVFELAQTVHPHPSTSEGIYEVAVHASQKIEALRKK